MKSANSLLSTPISIIIGSLIVAFAILWANGVIVFSRTTSGQMTVSFNQSSKVAPVAAQPAVGAPTQPSAGQPAAPTGPVDVAVGHFPIKGDPNAKVTIIEFADFRCPFCKQLEENVIPQIQKDYIDTGKAKFYFRHYAFLGPASTVAANAAECANEQGKFWDFHDYLYKNQPDESDTSMYTTDNLTKVAGTLGLDTTKFSSCLSTNKYSQNVTGDMSDGQKAGVNGTPATFVNGVLISGAQPYSAFKTAIDAALK